MNSLFLFFSSFCILLLYLLSGFGKLMNIKGTVDYLHGKLKLLPSAVCFLGIIMAIILQILGSLFILYSVYTNKYKQYAYYIVALFIIFNIFVTFIFHYPPVGDNYYDFLKNLSITGGFLLLLGQL